MPIDAPTLNALIAAEIATLTDGRVATHLNALLVEPRVEQRRWDYGSWEDKPDLTYPCWMVLDDSASNTGICYSEFGFGPNALGGW